MNAELDSNMGTALEYFAGVSFPRSGHHLLERVLTEYFEGRFNYCEFYGPEDCCKTVPCARRPQITLSKNHDYRDSVPIVRNMKYLIQYRAFLPALVSNYELKCRNSGTDSRDLFWDFSRSQKRKYLRFMDRWSNPPPAGSTFLRVSYEHLTTNKLETFSRIIEQFELGRKADRARLEAILESMDRLSVEGGKAKVEKQVGVAQFRDVTQFRHYDEARFNALDFETSEAFAFMESLPGMTRTPPVASSSDRSATVECGILIDASGQLRFEGEVHTGVPRVQDFIVRAALTDADPQVRIVSLEPASGRFEAFDKLTHRLILKATRDLDAAVTPEAAWSAALQCARLNPLLGKAFDRMVAERMAVLAGEQPARGQRKKRTWTAAWKFLAHKNLIRLYRLRHKISAWRSHVLKSRDAVARDAGVLIASHLVLAASKHKSYRRAAKEIAFVFHDNIALDHPDYLAKRTAHQSKSDTLKALRRDGALALCASDYSLGTLRKLDREIGTTGAPAARFPMPSTLYYRAIDKGFPQPDAPAEPFVIYCSTIEVRKNHLLLAKVWKRALDDGRDMPRLVNVGKWGWGTDALQEYLDRHPQLQDKVRFTGAIGDRELVSLYRTAAFGVFPSFLEGWGLGASECLDFGLPVIVSTAAALSESTGGLMPAVDPNDEDEWYDLICRWAGDPGLLAEYRRLIAEKHRPVSEAESWSTIKKAVRSSFPPKGTDTRTPA